MFELEKSGQSCVNVYLNKLKCLLAVVSQEAATFSFSHSHFHDYFSKSIFKILSVCLADNLLLAVDSVVNYVTGGKVLLTGSCLPFLHNEEQAILKGNTFINDKSVCTLLSLYQPKAVTDCFQPSSLIILKYMEHLYKLLTADSLVVQTYCVYFKTSDIWQELWGTCLPWPGCNDFSPCRVVDTSSSEQEAPLDRIETYQLCFEKWPDLGFYC